MITRIEIVADNLKAESRQLTERAVSSLRAATLETAGLLVRTKRPALALADTGLKINELSHRGIERLLRQQLAAFEALVDGGAKRLETAARAPTLKALVDGQIAVLPASRDAAVKNARKTVEIVRSTGGEFGGIVREAIVDLSGRRPARKAPVRRKKAAARKPAVRKAAPRKAQAGPAARRGPGRPHKARASTAAGHAA
jgi:phasin family protein